MAVVLAYTQYAFFELWQDLLTGAPLPRQEIVKVSIDHVSLQIIMKWELKFYNDQSL